MEPRFKTLIGPSGNPAQSKTGTTPDATPRPIEAQRQVLLSLMAAYAHEDHLVRSDERASASLDFLQNNPAFGQIELILDPGHLTTEANPQASAEPIGYWIVSLGFSAEFGGQDAFLDELYLAPSHRGQGLGKLATERAIAWAAGAGAQAIHLEVDRDNNRARALYQALKFTARERYTLMSRSLQ